VSEQATADVRPAWATAWTPAEGSDRARALFRERLGHEPDGVWSAPGRVNLIGEHTDYNGGLCLPTALPHRTYVALSVRDDDRVLLASAQADGGAVWEGRADRLGPGELRGFPAYTGGVAWALDHDGVLGGVPGFEAAVDACVPFGAGLSSSASLSTSVAVALDEAAGDGVAATDAGRVRLVAACVRAENDVAGAPTGGLDQSAALRSAEGHALLLDFRPGLSPEESARRVPFDLAAAGLELLVIDTRAPHELADGQYAQRRATCEAAARTLGVQTLRDVSPDGLEAALTILDDDVARRRVRHVVTEVERVERFVALLESPEGLAAHAAELGELFVASHGSLRDDYEVSCPELDVAVDTALAAGALGARMTGGGFGGSAIAIVPAGTEQDVARAVVRAFAERGFAEPQFLTAEPSGPAHREA